MMFEQYDFPPFRPPNEAGSVLIRLTRGCPWNKCEFCAMYKQVKFEVKPFEEVKKDILKARQLYGSAFSIFLGDSDNLVHKNLPEIMAFIRETFPEVERVTAYARAKTVLRRKMDFLIGVRKAGLDRLHIGLESGDAVVLERLRKGVTPEEMIGAGRKAKEAGFEVSFYVLSGAGGKDRWREHAEGSARVLNESAPDFIRLRTLTVQDGTPLKGKKDKGEFAVTPPLERLREVELFIARLVLKDCFLASDHLTNYLWAGEEVFYRGVAGELPGDKEAMLKAVRCAIEFIESTALQIKDSNQLYEEGLITSL
jgi:radical SAM superfamily enzyme YgiQ (UPF0313 family)